MIPGRFVVFMTLVEQQDGLVELGGIEVPRVFYPKSDVWSNYNHETLNLSVI
jgi:hypothetical protein